jgi:hypothetical protein
MLAPWAMEQNREPLIVRKHVAPRTWPCPVCGKKGRRERKHSFRVRHLAHKRPCFWDVTVGVYKAKCSCCRQIMRKVNGRIIPVRKRVRYFTSTVEGLGPHADYTDAVREKVVDLVVRDRLPNSLVIEHLKEDFELKISTGYIYLCLGWAKKKAA